MRTVGTLGVLVCAAAAHAQWQARTPAPEARSRAAGAIIGGTFYYMGGEAAGGVRNLTCWKYDIPGDAWTPIADMPATVLGTGVSNVDAAAVGPEDIYLIGGWTGTVAVNTVLRYNTNSNTWQAIATDPCPTPIYAHAAVTHDNKVYVVGGATASGVLNVAAIYVFNPSGTPGTRWSTLPALAPGRQYPGAAVVGDKIYAGGGIGTSTLTEYNSVLAFDIPSATWNAVVPMSAMRGGMGMFDLQGEPYAVAGGWSTFLASGEVLSGGAWGAGDPLNTGCRSIAYDGNGSWLVKAGGWNGAYMATTEVYDLGGACYPDCDGNQKLNVNDYICFQTKFALGDPYADCDNNGVRNVNDYICFQTKFALGC